MTISSTRNHLHLDQILTEDCQVANILSSSITKIFDISLRSLRLLNTWNFSCRPGGYMCKLRAIPSSCAQSLTSGDIVFPFLAYFLQAIPPPTPLSPLPFLLHVTCYSKFPFPIGKCIFHRQTACLLFSSPRIFFPITSHYFLSVYEVKQSTNVLRNRNATVTMRANFRYRSIVKFTEH